MKTQWDYTKLADAYLKRPDYSQKAIDSMIKNAKVEKGDNVCDIGAGVAHLTLMLARKDFNVYALEPNDEMRRNGIERTKDFNNVKWFEAIGEKTTMPDEKFKLVTFGSSFNVTDRQEALKETSRILTKDGWFACMWNHRNFEDTIQSQIEQIIKSYIKEYDYGTRREDQTTVINNSGLFEETKIITGEVNHKVLVKNVVEGWYSHATLHRQAGEKFENIIEEIEEYLISLKVNEIIIPYTTKIWMAQVKK